jgi:hypothetical protein
MFILKKLKQFHKMLNIFLINVGATIFQNVGSNFFSKEMLVQIFSKIVDPSFMKNVVQFFSLEILTTFVKCSFFCIIIYSEG